MRVAAYENCKSNSSATLPDATAFAHHHAQLIAFSFDAHSESLCIPSTDDAPLGVETFEHGKVMLAKIL